MREDIITACDEVCALIQRCEEIVKEFSTRHLPAIDEMGQGAAKVNAYRVSGRGLAAELRGEATRLGAIATKLNSNSG